MNLLPDLIGAILLALFAILAIKTWDMWCVARANRRQDKFNMAKRDREAMRAAMCDVLREALNRGKK